MEHPNDRPDSMVQARGRRRPTHHARASASTVLPSTGRPLIAIAIAAVVVGVMLLLHTPSSRRPSPTAPST
jgi:hypothetical protein